MKEKIMDFSMFKISVAKQFEKLQKFNLFRTQTEKDKMWETYLKSFPEGSNPIYKERTEYDCNCCKQFVRAIGNVVAIIDGKIESIWDVEINDPNYQVVTNAMSALVKSNPIVNIFLHTEKTAGTDKNFQQILDRVQTWQHFFVNIKSTSVSIQIGTMLSETRSVHDVLFRSLKEIKNESIEVVIDLISQNSLYRGEEHKFAVTTFKNLKRQFDKLSTDSEKDIFTWSIIKDTPSSVSKIRSTVIGTLLTDISEGKDIEDAVKTFESKVAPTNYKRPTTLTTKAMVEKAQKTIADLGLTSALDRRYATIQDITINNILFANREAKKLLNRNIFDKISAGIPDKVKNYDKVEEIPIEKFLSDILPRSESIEVMFENRHTGNLMSLISPVDPTAGKLFKWDNNFSWSYNGELADSIKERVKKAGGNVTGDLCCRLAWFNYDDLDFHLQEPGGNHIYYKDKHPQGTTGQLDVDMNAGSGTTRNPVENIYYRDKNKLKEGIYILQVHNFNKRETVDIGFEVEIDFMGTIYHFTYDKAVKNNEIVTVVEFKFSYKGGLEIIKSLPSSQATKEIWGIKTKTFHNVNVLMSSPNYWDGRGVGNKHYFFMIEGCLNDGKARGFFNEFLKSDLDVHRKVFEVVGSKMKTDESKNQLSGIGFSSTQRNSVLCSVKGSFSRTIKIMF